MLSWQPETAIADNGASAKHDAVFLRQSQSRDFSVSKKYAIASIEALTLSGFEDGEYFFQIVSPAGNSNVLQVRVQHHALSKAMGFFLTGLLLFVVLACSIFFGLKQSKDENLG